MALQAANNSQIEKIAGQTTVKDLDCKVLQAWLNGSLSKVVPTQDEVSNDKVQIMLS